MPCFAEQFAQLMLSGTARDIEAATFYLLRAARKLRLAGVSDRDDPMRSLRQLMNEADDALRAAQQPPPMAKPEPGVGPAGHGVGGATTTVDSCIVC